MGWSDWKKFSGEPILKLSYNGCCRGNSDSIEKTESFISDKSCKILVVATASSCDFSEAGSVFINVYIDGTNVFNCSSSSTSDYTVNTDSKQTIIEVEKGQTVKYEVSRSSNGYRNPLYASINIYEI